jgi:hypothetical protein
VDGSRGEEGFKNDESTSTYFNGPCGLTVDKAGSIVVVDEDNHAIRTDGEAGTADGIGPGARFDKPVFVAIDERGRLLVLELEQVVLRVVDAGLVPTAWMGPVDENDQVVVPDHLTEASAALRDYGKLVEEPTLADVAVVVKWERFLAHCNVLAARCEYFRGLSRGCGRRADRRSSWERRAKKRWGKFSRLPGILIL